MAHLDLKQTDAVQELMETIQSLQNVDECSAFFKDLCTMQELIIFAQRLQVAKRLLNNETYEMIRSQLPVSSTTLTRVNTALQYGAGGYRAVLNRQQAATDDK